MLEDEKDLEKKMVEEKERSVVLNVERGEVNPVMGVTAIVGIVILIMTLVIGMVILSIKYDEHKLELELKALDMGYEINIEEVR